MTTETTPNIYALPNVLHDMKDYDQERALSIPAMQRTFKLVWALATTFPLWTFKIVGYRQADIFKDDEKLGSVGEEWYGSTPALFVYNQRISDERQRGGKYHTQDVAKAVLKVKKSFSPKTTNEIVREARDTAEAVVDREHRIKQRERGRLGSTLDGARMDFVRTMETQFVMWLKDTHNGAMLETMRKYEEVSLEMQTIQGVVDAMTNGHKHALVVLSDGKYIVKILDNVQLYDDTSLPNELRGKLGMLKLVEAEQMVTGIGCRVNAEVFVLILDEVKNEGISE